MKNLSPLFFLVFSLLCFSSTDISTFKNGLFGTNDPPATIAIDNQENGVRPDTIKALCSRDLEISVYATNLIEGESEYILPNSATPIYIRVIIGNNYEYTTPVEFFQPSVLDPINGFPIYYSTITIPTPYQNVCESELEDNQLENFNATVGFHISLVDQNGAPYPYELNDDPSTGIFSCYVFCGGCLADPEGNTNPESCSSFQPYEGRMIIDCAPCLLEHDNTGGEFIAQPNGINIQDGILNVTSIENNNYDLKNISSNQNLLESTTVSPNPFLNEVNINFLNQNSKDIKINIFDSKGQVIIQNMNFETGQQKIIIDSNAWEQGLYIIHIETTTEFKAYKIIKVNK